MLSNKRIAQCLIALQMLTCTLGAAGPHADESASPEAVLIAQVYAISGKGLSQKDTQAQMTAALQNYVAIAPEESRDARLTDALVSLGFYTQEDAVNIVKDASASGNKLASEQLGSQEAVNQGFSAEFQQLLASHPAKGAQFSRCDFQPVGYTFFVLTVAGMFGSVAVLPATNVSNSAKDGLLIGVGTAFGLGMIFSLIGTIGTASDC